MQVQHCGNRNVLSRHSGIVRHILSPIGAIMNLENPRERPLTPLQSGMRALYLLQKGEQINLNVNSKGHKISHMMSTK